VPIKRKIAILGVKESLNLGTIKNGAYLERGRAWS